MSRVMVINIGLPGSGKSSRAEQLVRDATAEGKTAIIHSTDTYFIIDGVYKFEPARLWECHSRNRRATEQSLKDGIDVVIVDNTNLIREHREVYSKLAEEYGYAVQMQVVGGFAESDCQVYAARNSHSVPLEAILRMAQRYQEP